MEVSKVKVTFKDSMVNAMTARGMFPSQAEEIIVNYIEVNQGYPLLDRWYDDVNAYPESMQNILWTGVKQHAAKWIAVNKPEAWFRPMFEYSDAELLNAMKEMGKNDIEARNRDN